MNKEKLKNQKGITLIALIITIIVMLILVAVTITVAVNGGLFNYAGKAVGDTKNAINDEQELANLKDNMTVDELVDKYTDGTPKITASEVQSTDFGKTVNYGVEYADASTYGNKEWEIFYADENHIYLITRGHLATANLSNAVNSGEYTGTSDLTEENLTNKFPAVKQGLFDKTYDPLSVGSELKYTSSNINMRATEYLLDSTKWSSYVDSDYADWAIGAPTLESFVKSYNAYYTEKTDVTIETPSGNGYRCNDALLNTGSVPQGTYLNHYTSATSSPTVYWLACPSSDSDDFVRVVNGSDAYMLNGYYKGSFAFRSVVCLQSGVSLKWNSTTNQYDLVKTQE